jgi:hypothetical protein
MLPMYVWIEDETPKQGPGLFVRARNWLQRSLSRTGAHFPSIVTPLPSRA